MTQGVLDLIQAIDSGDSVAIESAFNAEMAARVSAKLEDMRVNVAENMFSEASCGSKKKMSEEEYNDEEDDKKEKMTKEELDTFIASEGFAELSEEDQLVLKNHAANLSAE